MKKTILVDFDGVIHSYQQPWRGARDIPDPPVRGAILWLHRMVNDDRFEICIYSARSRQWGGVRAMRRWLRWQAGKELWADEISSDVVGTECFDTVTKRGLSNIKFPTKKPAAFLTIDDRCICFDGEFPSLDKIDSFKAWNHKDV
jgi:hypothetical protein